MGQIKYQKCCNNKSQNKKRTKNTLHSLQSLCELPNNFFLKDINKFRYKKFVSFNKVDRYEWIINTRKNCSVYDMRYIA